MGEVDQGAFLVFAGHVVDNGDHIVVAGPGGEVRLEGTSEELQAGKDLLRVLDGRTPVSSLPGSPAMARADQEFLSRAASDVGAIMDWGRAWHWFHEISSNPPYVWPAHDPLTAYDMPRLAVNAD